MLQASTPENFNEPDGPVAQAFTAQASDLGYDEEPFAFTSIVQWRTVGHFQPVRDLTFKPDHLDREVPLLVSTAGVAAVDAVWGTPPGDFGPRVSYFDTSSCFSDFLLPPIDQVELFVQVMPRPSAVAVDLRVDASNVVAVRAELTRLLGEPLRPGRDGPAEESLLQDLLAQSGEVQGLEIESLQVVEIDTNRIVYQIGSPGTELATPQVTTETPEVTTEPATAGGADSAAPSNSPVWLITLAVLAAGLVGVTAAGWFRNSTRP